MQDHSAVPGVMQVVDNVEVWISSEGGFKAGSRVIVDCDWDFYNGKPGIVTNASAERTVLLIVEGKHLRFCVGALRHA